MRKPASFKRTSDIDAALKKVIKHLQYKWNQHSKFGKRAETST